MSLHPIHLRLAAGETLLIDGGMGTEIEKRGVQMIDNAWNAGGVLTAPDTVRQVHEDYIQAGAQLIITNTFSTSRPVLQQVGMLDQFEFLNMRAVELALEARANQNAPHVAIAGSMTTIRFKGNPLPSPAYAKESFELQAQIYADAGVDLIMLEMMFDIEYTLIALRAAKQTGLPVWVGMSAWRQEDGTLNIRKDGSIADFVDAVQDEGADALLLMHTLTENVDACLDVILPRWDGPAGVYAHSGYFEPPNWQFIDVISPIDYADHAMRWLERGVQVIGGCCGIGPEHIVEIRGRILATGI